MLLFKQIIKYDLDIVVNYNRNNIYHLVNILKNGGENNKNYLLNLPKFIIRLPLRTILSSFLNI